MADQVEQQRYKPYSLETHDCSGAAVWRCLDTWTGTIVSMTKLYVADMNDMAAVMRQVTFLMDLKHPNTVRLLDVLIHSSRLDLVFEHLDCDLLKYIEKQERITPAARVKDFLRQILEGLACCHSKNLVHGKLTPKSLLVDCRSGTVKLSDFGLTRTNNVVGHHTYHERVHPYLGGAYTTWELNSAYTAPEVLLGREECSFAADVWSVGCILALMLTTKHLFVMKESKLGDYTPSQLDHIFRIRGSPEMLLQNASNCQPQDLATKLNFWNAAGLDLIKRMLCVDPTQRITASDALAHEYLRDA